MPAKPVSIAGDPAIGSINSSIALIVFSDFQCPFCRVFAEKIFPNLKRDYVDSGRLLVTFKHFPLESIHPLARPAAEATACAATQGRFWPLHDALFLNQERLKTETITALAAQAGVAQPAFDRCLSSGADPKVTADIALSNELDITSTPTFLLGHLQNATSVQVGRRFSGGRWPDDFEAAMRQLASTTAAVATPRTRESQ